MAGVAIAGGADAPLALALGGAVLAILTRDNDAALAAADRAMAINTNAAAVLAFTALARCMCGAYEKAIEHGENAIKVSPLEPLVYHAAFALSVAFLLTGRNEEAIAHARKAIEGNRNFAFSYCVLAIGWFRLGSAEEAQLAVRRLLRVAPGYRLELLRRIRLADAPRLRADLDLLRETDLPE